MTLSLITRIAPQWRCDDPDLFEILRVLVDAAPRRRFLVLGSASPALLQQGSESLAGRLAFVELPPFTVTEAKELERLWLRGGFPRSYLARTDTESLDWRRAYISTFVERDARQLGFDIPALQLRRLWQMLAQYHGQTLNSSSTMAHHPSKSVRSSRSACAPQGRMPQRFVL